MTGSDDKNNHNTDEQEAVPTVALGAAASGVGAQIGPYKLLSILGEGGCGMVYLAEQRSLTRKLHGDLDWITMKAMEKDRMRRYQTAQALAGVYFELGEKEKTLEVLDGLSKSVTDLSQAAALYSHWGLVSILKDPGFAMELYRRDHELQPGNWLYLWGLGATHGLTGQFDQAIAKYTESTKLPGGANSINFFCLSMVYSQRGNKEEAASWYKKAVEQMPADRSSMDGTLLYVLDAVHSEASKLLGTKIEGQ